MAKIKSKKGKSETNKLLAYGDHSIDTLNDIEHIRLRPGVYIESRGFMAFMKMVYEIIDNACDEYNAGRSKVIDVVLTNVPGKQPIVEIRDYGAGIPQKQLEKILTYTKVGAKFNNSDDTYAFGVSGVNGMGTTVVNALSLDFVCESFRVDGNHKTVHFKKGIIQKDTVVDKKAKYEKQHGTYVRFIPDTCIYDANVDGFELEELEDILYQKACLHPNITINYSYKEKSKLVKKHVYKNHNLGQYLTTSNTNPKPGRLLKVVHINNNASEKSDIPWVEIAFSYTNKTAALLIGFANGKLNREGGTHIDGAIQAIIKFYQSMMSVSKGKDVKLKADDVKPGLNLLVSVRLKENPDFRGQTKERIANASLREPCRDTMEHLLSKLDMSVHKKIIEQIELNIKARDASIKAKEMIKSEKNNDGNDISKIARFKYYTAPVGKDYPNRELYLMEGESAGGYVREQRDKYTQGSYMLMGKILNSYNSKLSDVLKNVIINDIKTMSNITTNSNGTLNFDNLHYGKYVIATDADIDGEHITVLLITLFYTHFRPLIERGLIYVARPPLYRLDITGGNKVYVKTQSEVNVKMANLVYNKGVKIRLTGSSDDYSKKDFTRLRNVVQVTRNYIEGEARSKKLPTDFVERVLYSDVFNKDDSYIETDINGYYHMDFDKDTIATFIYIKLYVLKSIEKITGKKTKKLPFFDVYNKDGKVTHKKVSITELFDILAKETKVRNVARYKGSNTPGPLVA